MSPVSFLVVVEIRFRERFGRVRSGRCAGRRECLHALGSRLSTRLCLGGWTSSGRIKIALSDGSVVPFTATLENGGGPYNLFVRSDAAGEPVSLGGNAATGAAGASLMYVPVVVGPSP
jgi:hypothetical protein